MQVNHALGQMMSGKHILRWFMPLDPEYVLYQKYYLSGFRAVLGNSLVKPYPYETSLAAFLSLICRIKYINSAYSFLVSSMNDNLLNRLNRVWAVLSPEARLALERHYRHVGQYVLYNHGMTRPIKFAIDTADRHNVHSPAILDWCDVYFKSNYWPRKTYPDKVLPIVNCNGLLVSDKHEEGIQKLRLLRTMPKEWDLVFISRLRQVEEGLLHNVRLFEALAELRCKKYLLACWPNQYFMRHEELSGKLFKRLTDAGVEVVDQPIRIEQLWKLQAAARLVVIREGAGRCISWRMLETLCMGSCIVSDDSLHPEWPVPLREGDNFVNLGIRRAEHSDEGHLEDYQRIPEIIQETLEDKDLQSKIRVNNSQYFDDHASPKRVAEYVLSNLQSHNAY